MFRWWNLKLKETLWTLVHEVLHFIKWLIFRYKIKFIKSGLYFNEIQFRETISLCIRLNYPSWMIISIQNLILNWNIVRNGCTFEKERKIWNRSTKTKFSKYAVNDEHFTNYIPDFINSMNGFCFIIRFK